MVRCWGGNVYEGDEFFDWCDEHGVMVWQDFSFACAIYPQTEAFFDIARQEAQSVVRRLRHHPSVMLWCGDNEVDQIAVARGIAPAANLLTRRALAETVSAEDPHRPFLPSSPFIGPEETGRALSQTRTCAGCPEAHLWGAGTTTRATFTGRFGGVRERDRLYGHAPGGIDAQVPRRGQALAPRDRQWLVHGTDPHRRLQFPVLVADRYDPGMRPQLLR